MRVKVEFFDTEGCWHFSPFVHILAVKELLLAVILQDVSCCWVLQVTAFISWLSCFVDRVTLTIFEYDDVASVIPIKLTKNVIDIECSVVSIRWHLNWMVLLVEIFKMLLAHNDLCL